jgi:hypothetical protein
MQKFLMAGNGGQLSNHEQTGAGVDSDLRYLPGMDVERCDQRLG